MNKLHLTIIAVAVAISTLVGSPRSARADAHCFCSLAWQDNTNYKGSPTKGWIWDSGALATYKGPNQQGDANQTDCNTKCTGVCRNMTKEQAAQLACDHGVPSGAQLTCWSKVGTKEWKTAQGFPGTLINTPAVNQTTCTCPAGTVNDAWINGGTIQPGHKCTFVACDHYNTYPANTYPPNNTPVGTWGWTWGAFIAQWVQPTCKTVQTAPAVCKLQ